MITELEKRFVYKEYFDPNFNWNDFITNTNVKLDKVLTEEFFELFKDKIVWDNPSLYIYFHFSDKLIFKYSKYINWNFLCFHNVLSINIMKKFKSKIKWEEIAERIDYYDDIVIEKFGTIINNTIENSFHYNYYKSYYKSFTERYKQFLNKGK